VDDRSVTVLRDSEFFVSSAMAAVADFIQNVTGWRH